jgi:hypothetical protein
MRQTKGSAVIIKAKCFIIFSIDSCVFIPLLLFFFLERPLNIDKESKEQIKEQKQMSVNAHDCWKDASQLCRGIE